eukprot:gnl/MRDRNA2_/MRDRNA2_104370_c0_seq1.p1 gnl/MRDRNA2_/MRDRNA2_104370_c0~~gnl/MRDRNA2_/MRDRNA2_104370_c0_seq1.p1  ORF type:complete len:370 (-),score=82.56 gnl/MRDRNA2_/MRDRNA2_104370_c0_seq1:5-1114(-)
MPGGGYVRGSPKQADTVSRPDDDNKLADEPSGEAPGSNSAAAAQPVAEQGSRDETGDGDSSVNTSGQQNSNIAEGVTEQIPSETKEESSEAASSSAQATSQEDSVDPVTNEVKAKAGGHPLMIVEHQRLELNKTDEEAELCLPEGLYWEPTKPGSGDPYHVMEMIKPEPGAHYDNIIHVWHLPSGGELIGRPLDRSVLKMKGPDGKHLYGPEIDADTDKNGWSYSTKFERLNEPRAGGRAVRKFTDVVRSRLWMFGNEMPMPPNWWAMVPKVSLPGGGVLQTYSGAPAAVAERMKDHSVKLAGKGIMTLGAQITKLGEMVYENPWKAPEILKRKSAEDKDAESSSGSGSAAAKATEKEATAAAKEEAKS